MASVRVIVRTDLLKKESWTKAIAKAQKEISEPSFRRLKKVSPVDTGKLSNSWEVRGSGLGIEVRNSTLYTSFQNDGTRYIQPRRMIERSTPYIVDLYERSVVKWIDRID